jgi:hypothetical protein
VTSIFLLPVSAAAGLVIVKAFRWRHRRGYMPPRSALQREAAYASILARPTFERVAAWAALGVLLWILAEGFLLLAPSSLPKKMKFDEPLEHVVVERVVNFVQEGRPSNQQEEKKKDKNTVKLQYSPCQRVQWKAGGMKVEADLVIERCWAATPVDPVTRDVLIRLRRDTYANITETTFSLWAFHPSNDHPFEVVVLFKGYDEPVALSAYTTAWISGTDGYRYVRWPDKVTPQMWQMVPFYERMFDDLECVEHLTSDEASDSSPLTELDLEAVRVFRTCPNLKINSAAELFILVSQVLLDHVDLQIVDREGGFAASFITFGDNVPEESPLFSKRVTIGEIEVPRLNIVSSGIAGCIAVIVFMVVSRIPDFDATEAVLEHYDVLKAVYEHCEVEIKDKNADVDVDANVVADVDVKLDGGGEEK